jgi:S-adenosylmethionine-diacylgycerolhomoserine-N-methlytransferase
MSSADPEGGTARRMDRIYRFQRHVYDPTRRFFLLGRDQLIERLAIPERGSVLEIGCGTARNLVLVALKAPDARPCGIDVSREMLATARERVARSGLRHRIQLANADALAFTPGTLFGIERFDRIFFSYTLSMIPAWRAALARAAGALAAGGELHVVDFGDRACLPALARRGLDAWLGHFDVQPRADLPEALREVAERSGGEATIQPLFGGYAIHGRVALPAATPGGAAAPR